MHAHRYLFGVFVACAVGALGAATSAAQSPSSSPSTSAAPQSVTLTGCVEYGPRDTYILATLPVPEHPALSDETALEHQEVSAAEHSYQLTQAKGLSLLIGDKVSVSGTVRHVQAPASAPAGRGGRGSAGAPPTIDQLNASSVKKLSDSCGSDLAMFEL